MISTRQSAFGKRSKFRGSTPRRQGKSLIEMLVVITLMGVIFGITSQQLTALLRVQHDLEDEALRGRQLARLSREFRRDLHAVPASGVALNPILPADAAAPPAEGSDAAANLAKKSTVSEVVLARLEFAGGRQVTYAVRGSQIERRESGGTNARREKYTFPKGTQCEIRSKALRPDEAASGVELVLRVPALANTTAGRRVDPTNLSSLGFRMHRIVAEVGRAP